MTPAKLQTLDDNELMLRVAARDARAFEVVYDRYSPQAFGLAVHITGRHAAAEEVTQDAFMSLWRKASRFDPRRGALKTWLLSVVRNRAIDSLRRGARHEREVEIDETITARLVAPECTEQQVTDRDQARHTGELLSCLPAGQRQVIELAFFEGLTQTEIAATAGLPLGTVKGRQRLALQKMHQALLAQSHLRTA